MADPNREARLDGLDLEKLSDALNDDLHEARRKAAIEAEANVGLTPTTHSPPKQVIVMRKDLGMRKGKMIAQGAHASMKVLLDCSWPAMARSHPEHVGWRKEGTHLKRDDEYTVWSLSVSPQMEAWLEGRFTKVCVAVKSEAELVEVYERARLAGLPCALIEDAGLTEFKGVPTKTCCAIGPAYPENIDKITGHLKLL